MTLLYSDARFLDHQTGAHPEAPRRLKQVHAALEASPLMDRCSKPSWKPAEDSQLLLVHQQSHLDAIDNLAARGGGLLDPDTVVCPDSPQVARLAAGAVCDAVQRVLQGESLTALCLPRPPGHHALPDRAMGFCLFNSIAIAARYAASQFEIDRLLIVDWDVHHGNGTQDVFYRDGNIGFFSIHRWPFYPGTGGAEETGAADGLGATLNLPTPFGVSRRTYLDTFSSQLEKFADRVRPQLVLLSAGFDSHAADPIGSLGLETEDFGDLTRVVQNVAAQHAGGRLISVLEGGYNPPVLADCVTLHLDKLLESDRGPTGPSKPAH